MGFACLHLEKTYHIIFSERSWLSDFRWNSNIRKLLHITLWSGRSQKIFSVYLLLIDGLGMNKALCSDLRSSPDRVSGGRRMWLPRISRRSTECKLEILWRFYKWLAAAATNTSHILFYLTNASWQLFLSIFPAPKWATRSALRTYVTPACYGKRRATKPCLLVSSVSAVACSAIIMSRGRPVTGSGSIIQADILCPFNLRDLYQMSLPRRSLWQHSCSLPQAERIPFPSASLVRTSSCRRGRGRLIS